MNGIDQATVRERIFALLASRAEDATVCPSEVARALADKDESEEWRQAMPAVHAAIDGLVRADAVRLTWKGKPMEARSGPYRIAIGPGSTLPPA